MFGTILTWLSDHTSEVYFIATSNDISKLPPEFARSERLDAVFFLGRPTPVQKATIWQLYMDRFKLEDQQLPDDENWTGAEIKGCCRMAALLDKKLVDAAKTIIPVYQRSRESITSMEEYAKTGCLDSETGESFDSKAAQGEATAAFGGRVRKARRNVVSEKV
jgi:SpoVK/Ycf46/Vps4 family AAA+-type ATPase